MGKWYRVLALTAVLSGCAHAPAEKAQQTPGAVQNRSVAYADQTIVKGKTTSKEMLEKFGAPNSVERRRVGVTTGPAQVWNYWTAPPMQGLKTGVYPIFKMWVTFDDKAVVIDYKAVDTTVAIP